MKRIILINLVFFVGFNLFGQQQLVHEKKVYVSPNGKTYYNKAQPIYLWLSTSPDEGAKKYKLTSERSKKYSNPMYFDTEGWNSFRAPSAVDTATKQVVQPLQDIYFEVYADSKPPISSLKYGNAYSYKKNNILHVKPGIKIRLNSNDVLSGVDAIYYSLNKSEFTRYSDTITLQNEGEVLFQYYAVDNVGNVEKIKSITFQIDGTKPVSSLNFKGDKHENIFSSRSSISIESKDDNGVLAIYYQVDDGPKQIYKAPINLSLFNQGDHSLKYYAVDNIKNEEQPIEYSFYIDKTPPTIVEELMGNSFISNGIEYSSGRTKFKITAFDNKAGIKEIFYSINGAEYLPYEKPFYLDNSGGNLAIKTYAVDNVNNKSYDNSQSNTKVDVPYIDLSGPKLEFSFDGPMFVSRDTIFISKNSKINLIAKDPESGVNKIEYKIDEGEMVEYTQPFTIDTQGLHKIIYTSTDNVNNKNQNELVVIVDNSGPDIYTRFSIVPVGKKEYTGQTLDVYPSHVTLFLSITDNYVGFEKIVYSINDGPEQIYSGLIENFAKGADSKINITAYDNLGNITTAELKFSTTL